MGRLGRGVFVAAVAALAALCLNLRPATAERVQNGDLIVSLNGRIAPRELPRGRLAPVGVQLEGSIRTEDGGPLPRLDEVRLELAGGGRLSTKGLARCPAGRLRNADSHQALHRCGDALVGRGLLSAEIAIPEQSPFLLRGRLLAFNGTVKGRRAIWVHVFSYAPPISVSLPFTISRREGGFQTSLVAALPEWIGPYPRLAFFDFTLFRRFEFRGRSRSYASASCPIPTPLTAGFVTFARATYSFEDDRQLDVESVRGCRARER
jgi:hypothetical protein